MLDVQATVDYRLLQRRSALLLCTSCFRRGVATPIPQIVSRHHRPRTQCPRCAGMDGPKAGR